MSRRRRLAFFARKTLLRDDALARLVDAGVVAKDMIDFVDERRQGSSLVGVDPFQTFLGIERRCDRYYRDVACTTTDPAWGAWRP